jgi:UDP-glucuronate decarboxylase
VCCLDSFLTGRPNNIAHLEDDPNFVLVDHDVRAPAPVFAWVSEVYNLACPASPPHYQRTPIETAMTSAQGTLELLTLARRSGARFLLTSTSEVYGDPEVHPQPENYRGNVNPVGPRACYDEGKRLAESLAYDFVRQHRLDVRVARIFNTYGPRMRLDDGRVVSNLIAQALRGVPLTIYGSGRQTRSFCYVDDLVEGLLRLMRHPGPLDGPVNLGSAEEIPVTEIARRVASFVGRGVPITHLPLPMDDPRRRQPDLTRASEVLRWRPTVPLDEGLRRTIAYFRTVLAETKATPVARRAETAAS